MRAPMFLLSRSDILGILLVIVVVAIVIVTSVFYPVAFWRYGSRGSTFGPDWECQAMPKGEPICIRKVPRAPAD